MLAAVIPACNEADSISYVIENLLKINIDRIFLVANGCMDATCEQALRCANEDILHLLNFPEQLGYDIPRAIGAAYARRLNPSVILFIDGDMKGDIYYALLDLIAGVQKGLDMALTNCYPYIYQRSELALSVIKERETLNRRLGLFNKIGLATPSHGPHAISGSFLQAVPDKVIAIPPLSLAYAALNGFKVGVAAAIPHRLLGSHFRNGKHAAMIAQTIIGDCRQALSYVNGEPLETVIDSKENQIGYRPGRRFDLLTSNPVPL